MTQVSGASFIKDHQLTCSAEREQVRLNNAGPREHDDTCEICHDQSLMQLHTCYNGRYRDSLTGRWAAVSRTAGDVAMEKGDLSLCDTSAASDDVASVLRCRRLILAFTTV